jgi:uncharacterized protein (DUF2235 family)
MVQSAEEILMSKNIVLLSDGTGNSASKIFKTNVWRLYQALDLSEPDGSRPGSPKQIAYYDDGVGTAAFKPLALLGGAFGWGTKRNVLDLYTFLCRHYEDGDRIYCFGFSRGAFTIRMLTGLIANQGLVKTETEGELRQLSAEAFRAYREQRYHRTLTGIFRRLRNVLLLLWYKITGRKIYDQRKNRPSPKIKLLGLWDTVAAYGLPFDELTHAWNFIFPLSFPDRNLSDIVECAHHALAIDDERLTFHPELWNEKEEDYKRVPLGDRLNQVWFAGMHSNIGGGYPDDALSGVPLNWIMDKAEKVGLIFIETERHRIREAACISGKMYYSRQGFGGAYRYMPRKIAVLTHDDVENEKNRVIIDIPKIHESVLMRIRNRVDGYAPIGLPEKYEVVAANGSPSFLFETEAQAKGRANNQEEVWNLVWWKRIVYFMSVAVFVLLAAFPLYRPAAQTCEGRFCALSPIIDFIGTFLPNFLSLWLKSFRSHPGFFLLIAILLALILYIGSALQHKVFDKMRTIFDHPKPCDLPDDFIYRLRSNRPYQGFLKFMKESVFPILILVMVGAIILFVVSRGIFTIIDSAGFIGAPSSGELKSSMEDGAFHSNDLYRASGVKIEEDKRCFVNDAMLPLPGTWQVFYKDNHGIANVKIEPLD